MIALPLALSVLLATESPITVFDVNPGPEGSHPESLVALGDGVVFSAYRPDVGRELFVSDGTASGTRLIADLNPGPSSSFLGHLTALGNSVYFASFDDQGTLGLYGTDGSGIQLVRAPIRVLGPTVGAKLVVLTEDFRTVSFDPVTGIEETLSSTPALYLEDLGGDSRLRVLMSNRVSGPVPLVTDGSPRGTLEIDVRVRGHAIPYQGKLAVLTADSRILVTDGRPSGTRFLNVAGVRRILKAAGRFLFIDLQNDGIVSALDEHERILPLGVDSFEGDLLASSRTVGEVNGRIHFAGGRATGSLRGEPYGTDASSAELLGDLVPGPAVQCAGPVVYVCRGASLPRDFVPFRRVSYFIGGESDGLAVWRTDGTLQGTTPITPTDYRLLDHPILGANGLFLVAGRSPTGSEPAFLPLSLPKAIKVPVAPCRLWSSDLLPGTKTNVAVEGHCGVPVGAYSVQIDLTATFPDRTVSTVRLAASGAVPPAAATRFFGPKASRATQTVNIGPHGITVWNEGPGPGAIRISLDVSGYEAPEN